MKIYLPTLLIVSLLCEVQSQGSADSSGVGSGSGLGSGIDGSGFFSGLGSGSGSGDGNDSSSVTITLTPALITLTPALITPTPALITPTSTTIALTSAMITSSVTIVTPTPSRGGNFLMPFPSLSELYMSTLSTNSRAPLEISTTEFSIRESEVIRTSFSVVDTFTPNILPVTTFSLQVSATMLTPSPSLTLLTSFASPNSEVSTTVPPQVTSSQEEEVLLITSTPQVFFISELSLSATFTPPITSIFDMETVIFFESTDSFLLETNTPRPLSTFFMPIIETSSTFSQMSLLPRITPTPLRSPVMTPSTQLLALTPSSQSNNLLMTPTSLSTQSSLVTLLLPSTLSQSRIRPSQVFTPSQALPPSQVFTPSQALPPSQVFTPSQALPPSQVFTPSQALMPSQVFTPSQALPPSQVFTPSQALPPSQVFTPSQSLPPSQSLTPTLTPSRLLELSPTFLIPAMSTSLDVFFIESNSLLLPLATSELLATPSFVLTSAELLATPSLVLTSVELLATPSLVLTSSVLLATPSFVSTSAELLATPSLVLTSSVLLATPSLVSTSSVLLATPSLVSNSVELLATPSLVSTSSVLLATPSFVPTSTELLATPSLVSTSSVLLATPSLVSNSVELLATPSFVPTSSELLATPSLVLTSSELLATPSFVPTSLDRFTLSSLPLETLLFTPTSLTSSSKPQPTSIAAVETTTAFTAKTASTANVFLSSFPPTSTPIIQPTPIIQQPQSCLSLLPPGQIVPESSLVVIEIAVSVINHTSLRAPGGACEMETALTQVFVNGLLIGRNKRQAAQFDADVRVVGDLLTDRVSITFIVVSASNTAALSAATVVNAFAAVSPQTIGSFIVISPAISVTDLTTTAPTTIESVVIPLIAAVGAVLIALLILIFIVFCAFLIWNSKKNNKIVAQVLERGNRTFVTTNDFESYHVPKNNSVTLSQLAQPGSRTNLDAQRQSRAHDLVEESRDQEEPSQLVEPVAHYSSPPRGLNIRGTRSIVPSPSTATSHHSLTPNALRPSSRAAEAIQLREEALRLQEEREEDTLRARRKATMKRMLASERRRKRSGKVVPFSDQSLDTPSTYGSKRRRHWLHRQVTNRISPQGKHGRSHRGRPLTQNVLPISGRVSRGIAEEATRELAWLNTGNGVQLMSVQPLAPPIALQPTPLSSLPAVNPLHSTNFHQRQLDTYLKIHQDMERLQLEESAKPHLLPLYAETSTPRPPVSVAWQPGQYTPLTPAAAASYSSPGREYSQMGQLVWSPERTASAQPQMVTPRQLSEARQASIRDYRHTSLKPAPRTDPFTSVFH